MSLTQQVAMLTIQVGAILFIARCSGKIAELLKIPSVLGELLSGILIGPYLLGSIGLPIHGLENGIFPCVIHDGIPVSISLYGISTLGSIVLLFMSGLETDLRMFFRYSLAGTLVGVGGVVFSFVFGGALGVMFFDYGVMDPRTLFLGILSTATSVGITARILSERKSIDSPEGTTILAAAVIDDVLGIICLAVVLGLVGNGSDTNSAVNWPQIELIAVKCIGIWLGVTALGLICAHWIARFLKLFRPSGTYTVMAFGFALLMAGFFEQAGLAMIVGAYVMGLSLSKTDIAFSIQRSLHGIYGLLVPVFFVVMGMLVDVRVFAEWNVLKLGLIYSVLAIFAKIIGCALPALFLNFNPLGALRIGTGMIPRGEVALIIAGIGATTMMKIDGNLTPVITPELFGVAIIMTLITTIIAPPLLALTLSIRNKGVRKEIKSANVVHTVYNFDQEILRETVLRMLIENLRSEGYRHSEWGKNGEIIHFRREKITFSLHLSGACFDFESSSGSVVLIKTAMYETLVELHRQLVDLKTLAEPDKFGSAIGTENLGSNEKWDRENNLDKIVTHANIISNLSATTHLEAIKEMVQVLDDAGKLKDPQQCLKDVLAREDVVSTCLPDGIALPHGRSNGVDEMAVAIGISRAGCQNSSDSQEKSSIYVLCICPKLPVENPYLQFVGRIAAILSRAENRERLIVANRAEEIRQIFYLSKKHQEKIS